MRAIDTGATIHVNGVDLFYQKRGDGPPMVLLHGNGEDHHIFDALAQVLQSHYTLYLVDSRGHGQSGSAPLGYEEMAGDVYALIQALGIAPAHVLGFSDGAIAALLLARAHGGAVNRLALLGANLAPQDFKGEILEELRAAYATGHDPLLRLMLTGPNIAPGTLRAIQNPTLVLAGQHDIFTSETFDTIAAALPHAQLHVLPGHTHDSYINGSALLAGELTAFFG